MSIPHLRRRALGLIVGILAVTAMLMATSCDPSDPAQRQAFYDLNPEVGAEVTPETMNDTQRTVVRYVEEQRQAWFDAVNRERARERQLRSGGSLHPFLVCVRHHESDRGPYPHTNGYSAQNPRSTASGAYQFLNGTWRNASVAAGYPGYSRAMHAPRHVQDAVALHLYDGGRGAFHWRGSGCR